MRLVGPPRRRVRSRGFSGSTLTRIPQILMPATPRPWTMSRNSRPILIEMVSIVVAIVLGFGVTSWSESRRDRGRAEAALERIHQELEANRQGLARAAPYYAEISERLDSMVRADGDGGLEVTPIPGWRGLSPPSIRSASFTVATSTGALEHVDFAVADQIAIAYEALDDFSTSLDHALANAMAGGFTAKSDWLVALALLAEVAVFAEMRLEQTLEYMGDL